MDYLKAFLKWKWMLVYVFFTFSNSGISHPNTSNNSTTFTLSTSTPPPLIFKKSEILSKAQSDLKLKIMLNYAECKTSSHAKHRH